MLKSNAYKCQILESSSDAAGIRISKYDIKNSECEKLLCVKFDNKLTFEKQLTDTCRKTCRKIYKLGRISPYMELTKRSMFMNAFFNSKVNYGPLIWMRYNRSTNKKLNWLYERCLKCS